MAAPFRIAEFDIYYNEGISRTGELLDMAVESDLVEKSGTWFSYGSERMGQGRETARQFLKDHPEILEEIEARLRTDLGLPSVPTTARAATPDSTPDSSPASAEGSEN